MTKRHHKKQLEIPQASFFQSLLFSTTGIRTCLQQKSIILQQGLGNLNQEKYKTHPVRLMKSHQIISKALVWINSIYTLILLRLFCLSRIYLSYSYIFYYLLGWSCAEPRVEIEESCGSFLTQDILWFCDYIMYIGIINPQLMFLLNILSSIKAMRCLL